MTTKLSIYAEALSDNREYKNARINGQTVGVKEYRLWSASVKELRKHAYAIRQFRHDNMSNPEAVACDMSPLYDRLRLVLELVGEVNGAKLDTNNCAEEIIAQASRIRVIDVTPEMASARADKREAKKLLDEEDTEENAKAYADACEEVERLEALPGNCKKLFEIQSETTFIKNVEILLGDAINKQCMKTLEQVLAEEEAKRAARRAATKAKRAAKKAAK